MIQEILLLVFWLVVIVAAAEVFTNAIESLGARLKFSEGVTGSIFAAVGTALPETMVPLVAIFGGNSVHVREEVGVGAILGAPFMLSTLAMFLIGAALWQFQGTKRKATLAPERSGFRRDIEFFLFAFTLAFLVAFTPQEYRLLRVFIAAVLVITYFYYILETVKASAALVEDGHATENSKPLYLGVVLKDHMWVIVLQLLIALGLIIAGAKGFVHGVEYLSEALRLPVMALSLLIIPVATELPEKVNSIIWIRKGKDTMALGNITGAMVFQGTLLPAVGIFLTPWTVNLTVVASSALTIAAGVWLYFIAMRVKRIAPWLFIVNGALYIAFVYIVLVIARA
ncbi:sodium:calcium antiporter [bacterium]|nr:sodium:calcium antiporter [bacterium]